MTMNRWSRREGVENTEGIGSVTLKDARRTSSRYVPLLDSVVALSRSYLKQKRALTTHYNVSHLHKRDFVCTQGGCDKSYGYKHLLQRHVAQAHKSAESSDPSEDDNVKGVQLDIDGITGKSYLERSAKIRRALRCPYPHFPSAFVSGPNSALSVPDSVVPCEYVFGRAYDLRRHLLSEHGRAVDKGAVAAWAEDTRKSPSGEATVGQIC